MVQMIILAKQKERHRCREQMYGYQGGKRRWEEVGGWDRRTYTIDTMCKGELKRSYCIAQGALFNALW